MRILVVDDNPVSQLVMKRIMEKFGECVTASSGKEALEVFRESRKTDPFDLICLDLYMPDMTGHQVLKEIRTIESMNGLKEGERVRILIISASSKDEDVKKAIIHKCDGYLLKPINENQVKQRLTELGLL